jgi:hypothetical protein
MERFDYESSTGITVGNNNNTNSTNNNDNIKVQIKLAGMPRYRLQNSLCLLAR